MNWRHHVVLFILGLLVPFAISHYQTLPGYMDADYYFAGGIQLATGKGFTEPYIWNYLTDPKGLPAPSHTYWMPLASIISATGMWLASQTTYSAGRLPFILISACVPLLTATLAFDLSGRRRVAWVAGLLSIFSHYYAPFMPVPDNYGIYMLLGSAFLLFIPHPHKWIPVALGVVAGLMTLSRSDGLLWLGLAGIVVLVKSSSGSKQLEASLSQKLLRVFSGGLLVLVGYLAIMGFWHYRNWSLFGSFFTPGGGKLLWLQSYGETFIYPADKLSLSHFLEAGWDVALKARINAMGSNINTAIFAQGGIFLSPLMLIGLWKNRGDMRVKIAVAAWFAVFIAMSLIFPFAGARGGFHHAGAAIQPLLWAVAPIGMESALEWLKQRERFTDKNAPYVFHGLMVAWAVAFTIFLVNIRVVQSGWAEDDVIYASVEKKLQESGISPEDIVIVPNPPGYYVRTGRSAIRLPLGDESTVLDIAKRFGAAYLILEQSNSYVGLQDLYDHPRGNPAFVYLGEVEGSHLYRIEGID